METDCVNVVDTLDVYFLVNHHDQVVDFSKETDVVFNYKDQVVV